MKTIAELQERLAKPNHGRIIKQLADPILCKDGTSLSVQASSCHYSTPREDTGPYTEVEVWCIEPEQTVAEFRYNPNVPSGYVPVEKVVQFIDNRGGMV